MEFAVGNTTLTKDVIARRGYEIYERDIRTEVERNHDGRFLVVDVSTGRYEITNDELTAFDRAEKNPDGPFFLLRAGRRAAHRLGGRLLDTAG